MSTSTPPIAVLVHGAFADASGFGGVFREPGSTGHTVFAPPYPLRSLAFDASAIASYVTAIDGPVALVGHSCGGAVITQASATLGNVTGLVYLAAFGLDVGESSASVRQPFAPSLLSSACYPTAYDAPGVAHRPDLYVEREKFRETFRADVPVDAAEVMFATQRPLSLTALTENAPPPAGSAKRRGTWCLITTMLLRLTASGLWPNGWRQQHGLSPDPPPRSSLIRSRWPNSSAKPSPRPRLPHGFHSAAQ